MKPAYIIAGIVALVLIAGVSALVIAERARSNGMMTGPVNANAVVIKNFTFTPADIIVKKGTAVTWSNKESTDHSIISDDGQPEGGPSSPLIGQGQEYKFTFNTVGTFKYHCGVHAEMRGSVIVTE